MFRPIRGWQISVHTPFNPSSNNCLLLCEQRESEFIWYELSKALHKQICLLLTQSYRLISSPFFHSARSSFVFNEQKAAQAIYAADDYRKRRGEWEREKSKFVDLKQPKWASVASLHKWNVCLHSFCHVSGWELNSRERQAAEIKMFLCTDHLLS